MLTTKNKARQRSVLPVSNENTTVGLDQTSKNKVNANGNPSILETISKPYTRVIDVPIDGTPGKQIHVRHPEDSDAFMSLPAHANHVIRFILDGADEMREELESKDELHGLCLPPEERTYKRRFSGPVTTLEHLPSSNKTFNWSVLRSFLGDGKRLSDWYALKNYVWHADNCEGRQRETGLLFSPPEHNLEEEEAWITVMRDIAGNVTVVCFAPLTDQHIATKKGVHPKAATCDSPNCKWLTSLEENLLNNGFKIPCDPGYRLALGFTLSMLLRVSLVRNTETFQALGPFCEYSFREKKTDKADQLAETVVTLERLKRAAALLATAFAWLSKRVNAQLDVLPSLDTSDLEASDLDSSNAPANLDVSSIIEGWSEEFQYAEQNLLLYNATVSDRSRALAQRITLGQAGSVNQLTMLAAFFLPLSLAAAVLSMQTHFADLHFLLYDFVGVMIILAALASVLALLNRHGRPIYKKMFYQIYGDDMSRFPDQIPWVNIAWAGLWMLTFLVSFLIGMLKTTQLGWEVLGSAAAGVLVLWLASVFVARVVLKRKLRKVEALRKSQSQ